MKPPNYIDDLLKVVHDGGSPDSSSHRDQKLLDIIVIMTNISVLPQF